MRTASKFLAALLATISLPAFAQFTPPQIQGQINSNFYVGADTTGPQANAVLNNMNVSYVPILALGAGVYASLQAALNATGGLLPYSLIGTSGASLCLLNSASCTFNGAVSAAVFEARPSLPTISTCGTTPPAATAGSSNNGGQFTTGSSATTACTVAFASAFPTNAFCTAIPEGAANAGLYISAQSNSGFTITYTSATSVKFNYSCVGN